jgi:hypothetical protein
MAAQYLEKSKMRTRMSSVAMALAAASLIWLSTGCSYLSNRGNDLLDVADVGLTISNITEPGFVAFVDVNPILPLGFGVLQGQLIGVGHREVGITYIRHTCSGAIFFGEESYGIGLSPDDAHGRALWYSHGVFPLLFIVGQTPPWSQWGDVELSLHLGWAGLQLRLKPMEGVDLLIGITTLDLLRDDVYPLATSDGANRRVTDPAPASRTAVPTTPE